MNKVEFFNKYQPIAKETLELSKNYLSMKAAERAEKSVTVLQDMNKLMGEALLDELQGKYINLLG